MKVEGNPYDDIYTVNNQYIVRFKELTNDKMVVDGLELQIDTRYNRMHYASEQAIVVATMENDVIQVGDMLSLQYLAVEKKNNIGQDEYGYYQIIDKDQIHFILRESKDKKEEIIMLDKFVLIQPEETDSSDYEEKGGLLMPKVEVSGKERTGLVTHIGNQVTNVIVGDRVKLHRAAPYPLTINDKKYLRVRSDVGILYKYK